MPGARSGPLLVLREETAPGGSFWPLFLPGDAAAPVVPGVLLAQHDSCQNYFQARSLGPRIVPVSCS